MDFEEYAACSGFADQLGNLQDLAAALAERLKDQTHVFRDRKRSTQAAVVSQGWQERYKHYAWYAGTGVDSNSAATELAAEFGPIAKRIDADLSLNGEEIERIKRLAQRTFSWGNVTKGASKRDPTGEQMTAVILSALKWRHSTGAFMDAGWTKVAALSTEWVEAWGRTPQAIYDSRVAAALIRNIDAMMAQGQSAWMGCAEILRQRLRYVPSRDPTKFAFLTQRWMQGRRNSWDTQFFGSLLIRLLRDALNNSPQTYGWMPSSIGSDTEPWTIRGVEKGRRAETPIRRKNLIELSERHFTERVRVPGAGQTVPTLHETPAFPYRTASRHSQGLYSASSAARNSPAITAG